MTARHTQRCDLRHNSARALPCPCVPRLWLAANTDLKLQSAQSCLRSTPLPPRMANTCVQSQSPAMLRQMPHSTGPAAKHQMLAPVLWQASASAERGSRARKSHVPALLKGRLSSKVSVGDRGQRTAGSSSVGMAHPVLSGLEAPPPRRVCQDCNLFAYVSRGILLNLWALVCRDYSIAVSGRLPMGLGPLPLRDAVAAVWPKRFATPSAMRKVVRGGMVLVNGSVARLDRCELGCIPSNRPCFLTSKPESMSPVVQHFGGSDSKF